MSSSIIISIVTESILWLNLWFHGPVGRGCRIHRLHLCRRIRPPNECPGYDTEQSDDEAPVMLDIWGRRSTPSSPSLPRPLWPRVVAPDRVLSMGQKELNCVLMLYWIVWNRTVFVWLGELFEIELFLYAKLNYLKLNCFFMVNWIVWNRTVLTFNCE